MSERKWPTGTEADVLRAVHVAVRQYRHYGKTAPNEPEYRTSLISWLKEALVILEAK